MPLRVRTMGTHNYARPQYNQLPRILAPAYGAAAAPAQQTFGFDITSSALSKLPKFSPSTNPLTRRPRTGVTMQAAALPHFLSRLAVHSTATSSTPIAGRLPTPAPTAPPSPARRHASIHGG